MRLAAIMREWPGSPIASWAWPAGHEKMHGAAIVNMNAESGGVAVMAAYLMFCTYAPGAMEWVNTKRIDEALALIKKYGGELKAGPVLPGRSFLRPAAAAAPGRSTS